MDTQLVGTAGHDVRENRPINGGDEEPAGRLDRIYADQSARATARQRASVQRWQGRSEKFYRDIQNTVLGAFASDDALDVVEDLDTLMAPLSEDLLVWRGVRNAERALGVPSERLEELITEVRQSPMYLAASLRRTVVEDEFIEPGTDPAIYRIVAKGGAPAVWVPPLGNPDDAYQEELLFARGVAVRILSVDRTYSVPIVDVEVSSGGEQG